MTPEQAANEIWERWFEGTVDKYNTSDPPTPSKILEIIHTQRTEAVAEATKWQPISTAPREGDGREMKSQRECHEALCAGKTLLRHTGEKVRYNDLGFLCGQRSAREPWRQYEYLFELPEDWQIYEEPKPSASYEEAVAAKTVRIYWPDFVWQPDGFITYHREHESFGNNIKKWGVTSLRAFDLADRKGYRMEVVE